MSSKSSTISTVTIVLSPVREEVPLTYIDDRTPKRSGYDPTPPLCTLFLKIFSIPLYILIHSNNPMFSEC
jgi:hypothetical protein